MGFSRQEYWSGLPSSPGDLPDPGFEATFPASPALAGRFFTTESPGTPHEGGSLTNGIHALLGRDPRELPQLFCHVRVGIVKGEHLSARKQDQPPNLLLDLGLPASRAVRNRCLLFKSPCLWYLVIEASAD